MYAPKLRDCCSVTNIPFLTDIYTLRVCFNFELCPFCNSINALYVTCDV